LLDPFWRDFANLNLAQLDFYDVPENGSNIGTMLGTASRAVSKERERLFQFLVVEIENRRFLRVVFPRGFLAFLFFSTQIFVQTAAEFFCVFKIVEGFGAGCFADAYGDLPVVWLGFAVASDDGGDGGSP